MRGRGAVVLAIFLAAGFVQANPERVRTLLDEDRWQDALLVARRLVEARPDDPDARTVLGEALIRAGRLREASGVLEPVAAREKPPARALVALGRLRAAEGRDAEAASLMERALAISPDDPHVLYWAAGAAPTRARTIELLDRYLERSEGDDPDRIEGARGIIRTYEPLGERPVWVLDDPISRVEVPVRPTGDRGRTTGYVLEARLSERKRARLLLDTGASGLFLVDRLARKAGFSPLADEIVFGGAKDRHESRRGLLPSLSIGDLRFRDALVSTTASEIEPTGRYHGVLGISVFRGYRITLDAPGKRLILDDTEEKTAGVPYWEVSGQLLVEAAVSDGQRGLFLFDTGAFSTLVSTALVEASPAGRLGGTSRIRGYGGTIAGARVAGDFRVEVFGTERRADELLAIDLARRSRLTGVEVSGFVGLDVLAGSRIVIDTRGRTISVTRR